MFIKIMTEMMKNMKLSEDEKKRAKRLLELFSIKPDKEIKSEAAEVRERVELYIRTFSGTKHKGEY